MGSECEIHSGVLVESGAVIGNRVTICCNVQVPGSVTIGDDAQIGPNVSFARERPEASPALPTGSDPIVVGRGARIGANATLLPGVTVGQSAVVGPGTVISRSIPPYAIADGNPARIIGYVGSDRVSNSPTSEYLATTPGALRVSQATLHQMPVIRDIRGDLAVCEFVSHMPFVPRRYFVVYNVPSSESRGGHAHRECAQLLVAMHGEVSVVVDDGDRRQEVLLDSPSLGLHIPPMIWGIQYRYSPSAVLLVMASHPYSAADYIRDYEEFRRERSIGSPNG